MKRSTKLLAGVAGSVMLMSTAAFAADIVPVIPPAPAPVPVPVPQPVGFDFSGLYIGGVGGYTIFGDDTVDNIWTAGGQVGYNFVNGRMLYGVELRAGATNLGNDALFETSLSGRAGFLAGERVLLYGVAGVGWVPALDTGFWSAGGGAEIGVGQNVSLFAEARYLGFFGGGEHGAQLNFGVNWHL